MKSSNLQYFEILNYFSMHQRGKFLDIIWNKRCHLKHENLNLKYFEGLYMKFPNSIFFWKIRWNIFHLRNPSWKSKSCLVGFWLFPKPLLMKFSNAVWDARVARTFELGICLQVISMLDRTQAHKISRIYFSFIR